MKLFAREGWRTLLTTPTPYRGVRVWSLSGLVFGLFWWFRA